MLYQINYLSVDLAKYNGLAIIPFFIISLYYCLPYLFLAAILTIGITVVMEIKKKPFGEWELLLIGIYTAFYYFVFTLIKSVTGYNSYFSYFLTIFAVIFSWLNFLLLSNILKKSSKPKNQSIKLNPPLNLPTKRIS